jgi:poly [ADP-ribose] polymerase
LHKQREKLKSDPHTNEDYSSEFYSTLPFRDIQKRFKIINKQTLYERFELCQVLRDMVNISEETNWNTRTSVQSIYRSIGTHIKGLSTDSVDYLNLKNSLLDSFEPDETILNQTSSELGKPVILNAYEVIRPNENFNFNNKNLENVKLLFHGSKVNNFLGILTRGLLLPKYIKSADSNQNEYSELLNRTDIGNLGYGVYFADNLLTSIKYTKASSTKNTRLIAVCEVALGNCIDYYDYDTSLVKPPDGYDSVHGVRQSEEARSKFIDNEFVIYDLTQYRIKYIVELQYQPVDGESKILAESSWYLSNDKVEEKLPPSYEDELNLDDPLDMGKLLFNILLVFLVKDLF